MHKQKAQVYLELFANFTLTLILINTPISLEKIKPVIAYCNNIGTKVSELILIMKQHSSIGIIHLLFGIVFCISGFSQSQENIVYDIIERNIYTKSIGVKQGLPSSETYNVFQDSKGYVWISTDRGLARYNGTDMKVFTVQDGLPDNVVFELFEDSDGWIWIESMNGRASYIKNDSVFLFDSLQIQLKLDFFPGQYYNITEDDLGNIWFGYNKNHKFITKYDKRKGILEGSFIDTTDYGLNALIKCFGNGNFLYPLSANNKVTKSTKPIYAQDKFSYYTDSIVQHVIVDKANSRKLGMAARIAKTSSNTVAFSSDNQLFLFQKDSIFYRLTFNNYISLVTTDKQNNIWVGVINDGVYKINYKNAHHLDHYLSGRTVSGVEQDAENSYWFSTADGGVEYCSNIDFETPIFVQEKTNDKITDVVFCSGALQVGLQHGQWYSFNSPTNYYSVNSSYDIFHFICRNDSVFIKIPKIHTKSEFIWCYNGERGNKKLNSTKNIREAYFTADLQVTWIGSVLLIENVKTNKTNKIESIIGRIQCVLLVNDLFYVGSAAGLYTYNVGLNELIEISGISIDVVKIEKYQNKLFITTKGDGVYQFDNNKLEKVPLNLPNQSCNDMLIYEDNLYIATGGGVFVSSLIDFSTQALTIEHGLPSNEITSIEVFHEHLWLSSPKTLTAIPIHSNWINTVSPKVWVELVSVNDSIKYIGQELQPFENNIEITVASSSYKGEEKQFQYKFTTEKKWKNYTGSKLSFINLSPDDYQLEIKAVNADGYLSVKPAIVKFTITQPWYAKTWFIWLVALTCLAIIYIILKVRSVSIIKKIAKEEAHKRQLSEMELKALRSQMNPHFLFNAINSIQYFLIKEKGEEAKTYLSKFSLLVRNVLNHSRQEFITIDEEIKGLKLYMDIEKLRFENEFDYEIKVSNDLDQDFDKVPVMMIQPFVENAIWHGLMQKKQVKGKLILFSA
jgi:ligand-binding sensor domain-containing protein